MNIIDSGYIRVAMAMSFFIAFPVAAQKAEELFSLSLQELSQIKITGSTLTPEILKTVPAAVTVFSHEDIERLGLDTLDEAGAGVSVLANVIYSGCPTQLRKEETYAFCWN